MKRSFSIALFSMKTRREAAKANASSQPFIPFVASCGEWHNSEPMLILREPDRYPHLKFQARGPADLHAIRRVLAIVASTVSECR
jgi:hypothetical protein